MGVVDVMENAKSFGELECGTIFTMPYKKGYKRQYYTKAPVFYRERTKKKVNAINQNNGRWYYFEMNDMVIPYYGSLLDVDLE